MRSYEDLAGHNKPSAIREPSIQNRITKEYKEIVGEDGVRKVYVPQSDIQSGAYDPDFHSLMIENNLSSASIKKHDDEVEVSYPSSLDAMRMDGVLATCRAQGDYADFTRSVVIAAHQVADTISVTGKIPQLNSIENILIKRNSQQLGSAEFTPPFYAEEFVVDTDTIQIQQGDERELTAEELDLQRDIAISDTTSRVVVQMLESTLSRKDMDADSATVIKQIIESIEKR